MSIAMRKYLTTPKGLLSVIWHSQLQNSRRRGHPAPTYTKRELGEWLFSQSEFPTLYSTWVASGCNTKLKPSIDRLDESIGYTLNNIRLITWEENYLKHAKDLRVPLFQYTLEGKFVRAWDSAQQVINYFKKPHTSLTNKRAWGYLFLDATSYKEGVDLTVSQLRPFLPKPPYSRKVSQYTMDGKFIKTWASIKDAANFYSIYSSGITRACLGKIKHCNNFIWKYAQN